MKNKLINPVTVGIAIGVVSSFGGLYFFFNDLKPKFNKAEFESSLINAPYSDKKVAPFLKETFTKEPNQSKGLFNAVCSMSKEELKTAPIKINNKVTNESLTLSTKDSEIWVEAVYKQC